MTEDLSGLFFGGTYTNDQPNEHDHTDDGYNREMEGDSLGLGSEDVERSHEHGIPRRNSETPSSRPQENRSRLSGGPAPVHKKLEVNYDSDDARIIELKQQGLSDDVVCKKLREEGRVRYKPKTIGNRYLRLRQMKEDEVNKRLDEQLLDWDSVEDDHLLECAAAAKAKFNRALDQAVDRAVERVTQNMWKDVAKAVAARLGLKDCKFSGAACQQRFQGLKNGTALPPIDQDPDRKGREALRERRIAELQASRDDQIREKSLSKAAKKQRREEKEREGRERFLVSEQQKKRRRESKEAARRQQEEERALSKIRSDAREAFLESERKQIREQKAERHYADLLHRHLTGTPVRRPHVSRSSMERDELAFRSVAGLDSSSNKRPGRGGHGEEHDDEEIEREESLHLDNDSESASNVDSSESEVMPKGKDRSIIVNEETLLNPRSILTDVELELIVLERGLLRRSPRETHPQLVARLAAADQALSMTELDKLLDGQSADLVTREQKIAQLQLRDASKSAAGASGMRSTSMSFKRRYEGYKGRFRALIEGSI